MMARTDAASSLTTMAEINWDDEEHRRYIPARLVERTYNLKSDQTKGRLDKQEALVPEWRKRFHYFSLIETMVECQCECSRECPFSKISRGRCCFIYGAIFEYVPPEGARRHPSAPRYIVAFRGTMLTDSTVVSDLYLDVNVVLNRQHDRLRFSHARERVRELLDYTGNASDVWLAGHSLGASIALDVGRDMAMGWCYLPTFLFNPPQVSLAPAAADVLRMAEEAKRDLYGVIYRIKDVLGNTILRPQMDYMEALFEHLSSWVPEIYVHKQDLICKGFIDYFEQRQQQQKRFPSVARSAATLTCRDLLHLSAMSNSGHKKERPDLLPSARLWINSSTDGNPHELRQWWQPELMLSTNLYSWS